MKYRLPVRHALLVICVGWLPVPFVGFAQDPDTAPLDHLESDPTQPDTANQSGEANIHEFPRAETSLNDRQIANSLITSIRDLTARSPNLTVGDANGDRTQRFSIRGLRENNFGAGESAVGLYVDDIPFTDLSARDAWLFDAAEVEIMRGPQGTIYGAARPGGLIRVTTHPSKNLWRGRANISYGNYKAASAEAMVSGPIVTNKLHFNFSTTYAQRDGFTENSFDGSNPDNRQSLRGRIQLGYQPNEYWDLVFLATGNQYRDGMIPIVPLNSSDPYTVSRDFDGYADTESYNLAFKAAYQREKWRGVSVTTFRNWKQDIEQDFDFTSAPIRIGFTKPDLQELNQEFRFQSNDPDEQLQWNSGAFFSVHEYNGNSGIIELPQPPTPQFTRRTTYQQNNQNYALFGQVAYSFLEAFEITGGLRWDYDDRNMTRQKNFEPPLPGLPTIPPSDLSDEWNALQPRAVFAWKANESSTLYTSAAKGYQSGGFNPSTDIQNQMGYDQADSWTFELGSKSLLLKNTFAINATLFYTDTKNYQVFRPADPTGNYYMINAPQVDAYGAELELTYEPVERLQINFGFGYTHAEFTEFTDPLNGFNYDGNKVNFVPQLTTTLGIQYRFDFGLMARIETQIVGKHYWDEANTLSQEAYALLNARIGYEHKNFGIYFWGRNLTDQVYYNNALDFGADFGGAYYGAPGSPAMFGVSVSGNF